VCDLVKTDVCDSNMTVYDLSVWPIDDESIV